MEFPQTFGKYTLLKRLATGGMAEIFLARQEGMHGFEKEVVVKRLLPNHAENEMLVEMFLDEARIAAHLNHPNIAQTFDLGCNEVDGAYFIAMEYVQGVDLRRVCAKGISAGDYLPLNHAIQIIVEVCEALSYAHERTGPDGTALEIVHRDISPTNVLLSYDGGVTLVDFGIAKAANRSSVTATGQVKGKYGYMAPEQAVGGAVDARTDLFAVGINLYELTVGRRLFKGNSDVEVLGQVERCEILRPCEVDARYPEALERIVMRALAAAPDERYPSAKAMQFDLESYLSSAGLRSTRAMRSDYVRALFHEEIEFESKEAVERRALDKVEMATAVQPKRGFIWAETVQESAPSLREPPASAVAAPPQGFAEAHLQHASRGAKPLIQDTSDATRPTPAPTSMPKDTPAPRKISTPSPSAKPAAQKTVQGAPMAASAPALPPMPTPTPQPGGADGWGHINTLPPSAPSLGTFTRTPPPRSFADDAPIVPLPDDFKIKPPRRSLGGLLFALLVVVGFAAVIFVMERDQKAGRTGGNENVRFMAQSFNEAKPGGYGPVAPRAAPQKTLLRLTSTPPGARVVVNGTVLSGVSPTAVQTFSDEWATVRMLLPEHLPLERRVKVTGATMELVLPLELGTPPLGQLFVESAPSGATVWINGRSVGETPLTLPKVAAQTELVVRLEKTGFYPHVVLVPVPKGKRRDVGIRLVLNTGDRTSAVVNVETLPSRANVSAFRDNTWKSVGRPGNTGLQLNAPIGRHLHLKAKTPGRVDAELTLDVVEPFYTVFLEMVAPAQFMGRLSVSGKKGLTVYVGNSELGQTPIREHELPEGEHTLLIVNPETRVRVEAKVTVLRGQTVTRVVKLKGGKILLKTR